MKAYLTALLLLVPFVAPAQSSLSPEAQSAYEEATRAANAAGAAQIRDFQSQSRQSQANIDSLLLDQQINDLANQQREYQRQQAERARQQTEYQRKPLELQRAGQTQAYPTQQQVYAQPQATPQPAPVGVDDAFGKAVANMQMPNYAGNLPTLPQLQQRTPADIMREASEAREASNRAIEGIIRAAQENQRRQADANQAVVDALAKHGCIEFGLTPGALPVCTKWKEAAVQAPADTAELPELPLAASPVASPATAYQHAIQPTPSPWGPIIASILAILIVVGVSIAAFAKPSQPTQPTQPGSEHDQANDMNPQEA